MARTRLALESGVANETSWLRRGNKQKNNSPCQPLLEKILLLRFVRPQVNKILHRHHYCANYRRRKNIYMRLSSLHRKFHSDLSNERVNIVSRRACILPTCILHNNSWILLQCDIYISHCATIRTHLKVLINYCSCLSAGCWIRAFVFLQSLN